MKLKLLFIGFLGVVFTTMTYAQYTTPDTGVNWTLDDIATASSTTVSISDSVYTLNEDLIVAVNDTLRIDTNLTFEIAPEVQVTVFGTFLVNANQVLITAVDQEAPYEGFRFEEFSEISIQNATIEYGGGLRVLTETFSLDNCIIQNNVSGATTSAVVQLSRGIIDITNNHFLNNRNPAIASGSNQSVSGNFIGNIIEYNNYNNNNRPQINMGPTRTDVPLIIANNIITGTDTYEQVGGIAISNLLGGGEILAVIEGNTIRDNRYGITITGANAEVEIIDNIIEDNNIQGNPNLGGSGINLNSSSGGQNITITGNQIRRNLWGITFQGPVNANLGDDEDNPGGNVFSENGNGGNIYAISMMNNSDIIYLAKHNCWIEGEDVTLADAESVIFHQVDDASLGEVIFDPVFCPTASTNNFELTNFTFYPNPTQNTIFFDNTPSFEVVQIVNMQGRKVFETNLSQNNTEISFDLPQGIYFVKFQNKNNEVVKKLLVK